MARDERSDEREKMSTKYLSKEEVAKRMRELADNIKKSDLALEIQELADRVEKEGELEQYIRMKKLDRAGNIGAEREFIRSVTGKQR